MPTLSQSHKCREAVYNEILAMITAVTLPSITSAQVFDRLLPTDRGVIGVQESGGTTPAICVCFPTDIPPSLLGGSNITEDIGYPIAVLAIAAAEGDLEPSDNSDLVAYWTELITLHFHNKRLPGLTSVEIVQAEPLPVVAQEDFELRDLLVTGTILRCISRMQRV